MMLFWDLDGTILDVSEKYFQLYKKLVGKPSDEKFDKHSLWEMKRAQYSDHKILSLFQINDVDMDAFRQGKARLIEAEELLAYDILQLGAIEKLEDLSQTFEMAIVTLRKNRRNLLQQLEVLELTKYFSIILSPGPELYHLKESLQKVELLSRQYINPKGWMIGDSDSDINCAKDLKISSVGLFSGLRNADKMSMLSPTHLLPGLNFIDKRILV